MRSDREPLPWCDALDMTYCRANLALCATRPGWREWQTGRAMGEIIPMIDRLVVVEEMKTVAGPLLPATWLGISLL